MSQRRELFRVRVQHVAENPFTDDLIEGHDSCGASGVSNRC